jgi:hypothetical protein
MSDHDPWRDLPAWKTPEEDGAEPTGEIEPSGNPGRRRTAPIIVSAVVLGISGVLPILAVPLFALSGSIVWFLLGFGAFQLIAAASVVLLIPVGRVLGIVAAVAGVALGLYSGRSNPMSGLPTLLVHAYVIWTLATSGSAFTRR